MAASSESTALFETERTCKLSPDAEEELRHAIAEMERGEYFELTPEQLDRWTEIGEWPWPEESLG